MKADHVSSSAVARRVCVCVRSQHVFVLFDCFFVCVRVSFIWQIMVFYAGFQICGHEKV